MPGEGQNFLAQYYNRPYEATAKAMLCVMGSWEQVMDEIQAYTEAGARTLILRFTASDQVRHLEACAEQLSRRGYLR
jgi:alkanesulfonate monooxygenase SsuD/methylene tetrahydromethanopterin reductase-like flavin-dependent oxidoreductase (luciferase family)